MVPLVSLPILPFNSSSISSAVVPPVCRISTCTPRPLDFHPYQYLNIVGIAASYRDISHCCVRELTFWEKCGLVNVIIIMSMRVRVVVSVLCTTGPAI